MLPPSGVLWYHKMSVKEHDIELTALFERVYEELGRRETRPEIHAVYYPFSTLRHTIRLRDQRLVAHLSDIMRDTPEEILECIAHLLLAKLYRRKIKAEHLNIYRAYTLEAEVERRTKEVRRLRRGRVYLREAGATYDLREAFEQLNRRHFDGRLAVEHLSWSRGRTKRRLGYYDDAHNRIVISQSLDDAQVPRTVFEYVLYHEMLHIVHKSRVSNGRRCVHHADFVRDEKRFPHYHEAQLFLKRWIPSLRRKRRG